MSEVHRVACIFRSTRTKDCDAEYRDWSAKIDAIVVATPGYVSHVSFRDVTNREGVTISYFESLESIATWRDQPVHRQAQELGRNRFYEEYTIEIAEIVREYHWSSCDESLLEGQTAPVVGEPGPREL